MTSLLADDIPIHYVQLDPWVWKNYLKTWPGGQLCVFDPACIVAATAAATADHRVPLTPRLLRRLAALGAGLSRALHMPSRAPGCLPLSVAHSRAIGT